MAKKKTSKTSNGSLKKKTTKVIKSPAKKNGPSKKAKPIKKVAAKKKARKSIPRKVAAARLNADVMLLDANEVGCCEITFVGTKFYEYTTRRECEIKPQNYPGATVVFRANQACPPNGQAAAQMDEIDNLD
ncbi:MAG: hypothetical protein IM631_12765 [Cytophagales bacterium]|nr:hypothetical protein [Cytophagales bacterium]MCA6372244.1 hypothetical protein [Cytophagales bacterium]MCA6382388.1 hypothetical protein [Cytophagales bacterium]